jgi:hypothetical protein
LKAEQVQRLCGIESAICQMGLDSLVSARFLCVTRGQYALLSEEHFSRAQSAKTGARADLRAKKPS